VPRSLPQDWLAAIRHYSSGVPVGLGVFVRPGHLLTCSHVVAAALDLPPHQSTRPDVVVPIQAVSSKKTGTARATVWYPVDATFFAQLQDMCLLAVEMDEPGQALASWDELTAQEPRRTNAVKVFGYPFGSGPGKVVFGHTLADAVDGGWWQLDPPPHPQVSLDHGFSGSLVWDTQEDKPVGLLVAKGHGQVYLIPTGIFRNACAPLSGITAPPSVQPARAANVLGAGVREDVYDVFLCHSSQDKPQVRKLAAACASAASASSWTRRS